MKKKAICFTRGGKQIIERINQKYLEQGAEPMEAYLSSDKVEPGEGFCKVEGPLGAWTAEHFHPGNGLLFIGAVGIAVRALAGLPKDKLSDCPVVVMDDTAQFVIPILSGHAGGANGWAVEIAAMLGAVPVITTSTDRNEAFSVDTFAMERRLTITEKEGIRKVSVKALEEKKVTLSIKNYPPKQPVDLIIADKTDAECTLLLKPKPYTVGVGMKKNKDAGEAEAFLLDTLKDLEIPVSDVYALCTIDIKEDEPALLVMRDKYRIPVFSFDRELLEKAEGDFTASEFVREQVGVDNVCERAAVLGAGPGAELILRKQARDGMTIAVAKRMI